MGESYYEFTPKRRYKMQGCFLYTAYFGISFTVLSIIGLMGHDFLTNRGWDPSFSRNIWISLTIVPSFFILISLLRSYKQRGVDKISLLPHALAWQEGGKRQTCSYGEIQTIRFFRALQKEGERLTVITTKGQKLHVAQMTDLFSLFQKLSYLARPHLHQRHLESLEKGECISFPQPLRLGWISLFLSLVFLTSACFTIYTSIQKEAYLLDLPDFVSSLITATSLFLIAFWLIRRFINIREGGFVISSNGIGRISSTEPTEVKWKEMSKILVLEKEGLTLEDKFQKKYRLNLEADNFDACCALLIQHLPLRLFSWHPHFPRKVSLVKNQLEVSIYYHDIIIGSYPLRCWTYVTRGLSVYHQKELIFTIYCEEEERAHDYPRDLLDLIKQFLPLAQEGNTVDTGEYTELGQGFLGREDFKGIAYTNPTNHQYDGIYVNYPYEYLTAIFLTEKEMEVVKEFGVGRILYRLGKTYQFYPFPYWTSRARPEVAEENEGSALMELPRISLKGALAWLDHEKKKVTLKIDPEFFPEYQEKLEEIPRDIPFAFLCEIEPEIDSALVWHANQRNPEVFSEDEEVLWTNGFYLAFCPRQEEDCATILEDGFTVLLTDDSWPKLRQALNKGKDIEIPSSSPNKNSFSLEWKTEKPSFPKQKSSSSDLKNQEENEENKEIDKESDKENQKESDNE